MKLDIYKNHEIVKTYTADTINITFGVMEDFAKAVDLDKLTSGSDREIMGAVIKFVMSSMDTVKDLLKEIFEGITDEDIRGAAVSDICGVFADVGRYTIDQLTKHIRSKN